MFEPRVNIIASGWLARGAIVAGERERDAGNFSRNLVYDPVKIGEAFDCVIPTTVVKCLFLIKQWGVS